MPAITRDEVAHLARLARIELTDEELDHLAPQLEVILESVARVGEVAADDIPPTSHALPITNVARPDELRPGLTQDEALVRCARRRGRPVPGAADPRGGGVSRLDRLTSPGVRRSSWPPRSPAARCPPSRSRRRTSTASTRSTDASTRSSMSIMTARSPRRPRWTPSEPPVSRSARWPACRSRSRTCSRRRASRPRRAPRSSRAGGRRTTPRWSSGCGPPTS